MKKLALWTLSTIFLSGCLGMPEGVKPVTDFRAQHYLGRWYEIARLDHSFERGLSDVTAEYRLESDGRITVINCGFSGQENRWKDAVGKAYPAGESPSVGHLKVSFFGPFYGSYIIFDLDKNDYQYAYVSGPSKKYLWLLSRTPSISEESFTRFVDTASSLGFDTSQLIRVRHTGRQCPSRE